MKFAILTIFSLVSFSISSFASEVHKNCEVKSINADDAQGSVALQCLGEPAVTYQLGYVKGASMPMNVLLSAKASKSLVTVVVYGEDIASVLIQ